MRLSFSKGSFFLKAISILTAGFFISSGIFIPSSYADPAGLTQNETQQFVPVVTLDQANAQDETNQDAVPSGAAVLNENPLSAPTPVVSEVEDLVPQNMEPPAEVRLPLDIPEKAPAPPAPPAAPKVLQIPNPMNGWNMRFTSEPDVVYEIQVSSDLVHWTTRAVIQAASEETPWTDLYAAGVGMRFYRVGVSDAGMLGMVLDPATKHETNTTSFTVNYSFEGVAKTQTFSGLVEGANLLKVIETDSTGKQTIIYWNMTVDTAFTNRFLTYNGSYTDATLQYPGSVAISPNGRYVYLGDNANSGSITWFTKDAATGALTYAGRYVNAYTDIPKSIILSPDGKQLYTISSADGGVSWFSRDAATGALTYVSRCQDAALYRIDFLTLSPDGNQVYATSQYDYSIAWFNRNQTTGVLTYGGKYQSLTNLYPSYAASVSSDGKNVYVLLKSSPGAIVWLTRDASTGALTYGGKYQNSNIQGPSSAVVSADGVYVYVAADSKAVTWFSRDQSTGALTYLGNCLVGRRDLAGIGSIVLSPDNNHLYVALKNDNAVAWLTRNASTGAVTYNGMYSNSTNLKYAGALAVSPDGSFVYATAGGSKTIDWFQWGAPAHFAITTTGERPDLISGAGMTVTASTPYSPVAAYQWYLDGVALSGENTNTMTIGSNLAVRASAYELKLGVTISGVTDFKIIPFTVKNSFAVTLTGVQPNLEQDSNMIVSAATDYGANESYQWYLDGVALAGETNAVLVLGKGLQARAAPYELTARVTIGNITIPKAVNFTVVNRPYLDITGARALPYSMTFDTHTNYVSNAGPNLKVGWQASYIESRGFAQFKLTDFYSLGVPASQITKIEFITDYVSGGGSFSLYDMKVGENGYYSLNSLYFYPSKTLIRSVPATEYQKGIQMDVTGAVLADITAGRGWSGLILAVPSYFDHANVVFSPNVHLRIYLKTSSSSSAASLSSSSVPSGDLKQQFNSVLRSLAGTPSFPVVKEIQKIANKTSLEQQLKLVAAALNDSFNKLLLKKISKPEVQALRVRWSQAQKNLNSALQADKKADNYNASVFAFEKMVLLFKQICVKLLV